MTKYKVFNYEGLKIVLGKIDDNMYVGFSVDPNLTYSKPVIRASAREVVDDCILFYKYQYIFEVFDMN